MTVLEQSDIDALIASAPEPPAEPPPASTVHYELPPSPAPTDVSNEVLGRYALVAQPERLARLLPIKVPISVRLAETQMSVDRLLDLTVGTIIEFDRSADSDLDLVANNVPIGYGNAVKCGERFGLRVIKILPFAQRLLAEGLIR